MNAPAWIVIAAFPIFLIAFAAPSAIADPDSIRRQILGDDAQSRLENERRARDLARQQEQAWQQLQRMNDDSSRTQTYNLLGCPDINDLSDMSCEAERQRMNEGRGIPPDDRRTNDPYTQQPIPPQATPTPPKPRAQQRPADQNCGPTGLFGAPTECFETNTMTVGQGPCRRVITYAKGYEDTASGSGNLTRAQLTRCEKHIEAQQKERCQPNPKDGQRMYSNRDACKYRVKKEIVGERGLY